MSNNSPLERLAALLAAVGAQPDLTPERLAPSTVYDLEYRVLIVAMAFQIHAAPDKYSIRPRIPGAPIEAPSVYCNAALAGLSYSRMVLEPPRRTALHGR